GAGTTTRGYGVTPAGPSRPGTVRSRCCTAYQDIKKKNRFTNTTRSELMTETTGAKPRTRRGGKGLKIERIFTTPGVHPYDQVTWDKRDIVQANWKSGETIFEQRGVEFPDFW